MERVRMPRRRWPTLRPARPLPLLLCRRPQLYTDLTDIKRCIINTHAIDPQVSRA
jgi:hypothetical protein